MRRYFYLSWVLLALLIFIPKVNATNGPENLFWSRVKEAGQALYSSLQLTDDQKNELLSSAAANFCPFDTATHQNIQLRVALLLDFSQSQAFSSFDLGSHLSTDDLESLMASIRSESIRLTTTSPNGQNGTLSTSTDCLPTNVYNSLDQITPNLSDFQIKFLILILTLKLQSTPEATSTAQ